MEGTGKVVGAIGMQLLGLALLLAIVFALVWAAARGWKKGQESSYCIDGNKNCYSY